MKALDQWFKEQEPQGLMMNHNKWKELKWRYTSKAGQYPTLLQHYDCPIRPHQQIYQEIWEQAIIEQILTQLRVAHPITNKALTDNNDTKPIFSNIPCPTNQQHKN